MSNRYRDTWIEINLKHIHDNYITMKKILHDKTIIPVVKADAYGHGSIEVVNYLRTQGINFYAVSLLEEAIELRNNFQDIEILMLGVIDERNLNIAETRNIIFTLSDMKLFEAITKYPGKLRFHVKFDSGMNRLGIKKEEDLVTVFNHLEKIPGKFPEGLYTHFATADSNRDYFDYQYSIFKKAISRLSRLPKMIHASNTSSALKYEKHMSEMTHVRIGISLYGLSSETNIDFLKPTFKLNTIISQIKHLNKGDYLGYGITYQAEEDEIIGIIPIGYADGFIRKNKHGLVEIDGKHYSIVGNICMDQTFVKIDCSIDDTCIVTLMGGQKVSIDDVAKRLETINYEVICTITKRVPRVYIK